jgi:hypothetical protein
MRSCIVIEVVAKKMSVFLASKDKKCFAEQKDYYY